MSEINSEASFTVLDSDLVRALDSLPPASSYLVALSGGLDSSALLTAMLQWRNGVEHSPVLSKPAHTKPALKTTPPTIRALHVNHGLSPHADDWVEHCEALCRSHSVPLITVNVEIPTGRGGFEALARKARYQAFAGHLREDEVLVLAHHRDDQLETILMRMQKGVDVALLAGIPESREIAKGFLARPWLGITRQQIELWAQAQGITWVEDESNSDLAFTRNRLRHQVLPKLSEPLCHELLRLSDASKRLVECQAELCDNALALCSGFGFLGQSVLMVDSLRGFSRDAVERLLRAWLSQQNVPQPSEALVKRFYSEFVHASESARSLLAWRGIELRLYAGKIYLEKPSASTWRRVDEAQAGERGVGVSKAGEASPHWQGVYKESETPLILENGKYRIVIESSVPFELRTRKANDRFGGQPLKRYWRELGLPNWLREDFPLLVIAGELEWAGSETSDPELSIEWLIEH